MTRDIEPMHSVLDALTAQGYPITGQRRLLVSAIARQSNRFSAEDLIAELQHSGTPVGRATVFRTLELMTRLGILGRVGDGEHSAYTVCDHGHHYHLVCTGCGQVLHVDECPVEPLLGDLEARTGFRVEHHRLEIAGLCRSCQVQARA